MSGYRAGSEERDYTSSEDEDVSEDSVIYTSSEDVEEEEELSDYTDPDGVEIDYGSDSESCDYNEELFSTLAFPSEYGKTLKYGKHKGETFSDIVRDDPLYMKMLMDLHIEFNPLTNKIEFTEESYHLQDSIFFYRTNLVERANELGITFPPCEDGWWKLSTQERFKLLLDHKEALTELNKAIKVCSDPDIVDIRVNDPEVIHAARLYAKKHNICPHSGRKIVNPESTWPFKMDRSSLEAYTYDILNTR